ncbi:MAG: hypothetical protein V4681_01465 [Patescibacteria group bacterium]
MSRTTILILIAVAVLFLIAAGIAMYRLDADSKREVVNQYRSSMFTLSYPLELELEESSNSTIAIGSTTPLGFDAAVVAHIIPLEFVGDATFDSLVEAELVRLCTADSATERVSCPTIESSSSHETAAGESATEYYLTLARTSIATGETVTERFGPIYVFPVSAAKEEGEGIDISALVLHTPLPAFLERRADGVLLSYITEKLTRGPRR